MPTLTLIRIIIPDGFHGPVLIDPGGPGEPMAFRPGQRQFPPPRSAFGPDGGVSP